MYNTLTKVVGGGESMDDLKKNCNSCFKTLALSEFSKQSSSKDGYKYRCKDCDKRYFDRYYAAKQPEILETVKLWQSKNPGKVFEHKKKYRDAHRTNEVPIPAPEM